MSAVSLPPVENEAHAPLAGDVDNCVDVSARWALRGVGYEPVPSIPEFRAAAGVPDSAHHIEGMDEKAALRACIALAPATRPTLVRGSMSTIVEALGPGTAAILFVRSSLLPVRYGFPGLHGIGAALVGGKLYIANPLAPAGSKPRLISAHDLERAMRGYPGGPVAVVLHQLEVSDLMLIFDAARFSVAAGAPFYGGVHGRKVGSFSRACVVGSLGPPMDDSPDHVQWGWRLVLVRTGAGGDGLTRDKLVWMRRADLTPVPSDPSLDAGIRAYLSGLDPINAAVGTAVNQALDEVAAAIEEARP